MQTTYINKVFVISLLSFLWLSCKKFVEVAPPINQIVNPLPFQDERSANSAIIGIYSEMMRVPNQFCNNYATLYAGMCADELYYYSPSFRDEFVENNLTQANHTNLTMFFWQPAYKYIYTANLCLEQLNVTHRLTEQVKNSLIGECKFIRAFCYFHLVNLFGDIPLPLSSDYRVNESLSRSPIYDVYNQITKDLKDAEELLSGDYLTFEKIRPNKWAAAALLARVYLYQNDWANAEAEANKIINSGIYFLEPDLNNVFLKNSEEAIWQLKPVNPTFNTYEGNAILQPSELLSPTYLLTSSIMNAFEVGDQRKIDWVGSRIYDSQTFFYPYKYKIYGNSAPLTEYYMVLRLAEQYLIRAEARVHENNLIGAVDDLNIIRGRAGLPGTIASSQLEFLSAIEHERQIELFAEWGHRWYDLKRTERATFVLQSLKPSTWQETDLLWPIPQDQITLNNRLTQNPGY